MIELNEFIAGGKVDEEVLPILLAINTREDAFTSSSCAGRIGVMELPEIGDKPSSNFLGKWHREVQVEEVREAMDRHTSGYLYLLVQAPILHVYCRTKEEAKTMFILGKEAGFKDTSYVKLKPPYLVQFLSTEYLQVPLGKDGIVFPDEEYLAFLVDRANHSFRRARGKLKKLDWKLQGTLKRVSEN